MTDIRRRLADRVSPLLPVDTGLKPEGTLPARPEAFLFDVYGTLLISASGDVFADRGSETMHRQLDRLLAQYAISRKPGELMDALSEAIAATHEKMRQNGVDYPEVEIDRVWQSVLGIKDRDMVRPFAAEYEMTVNPVYPMPGAASIIATIREKKIPAGIISNAQFYTGLLFALFFGESPENSWADPELVFYSFEHGYAKPSAYMYEKAAAALRKKGIDVNQALYIGNDMVKDIGPAAAAGFKTALFAGDARSLKLGEDAPSGGWIKPDIVITALDQLGKYM